jgi:cytochrome c-type biogenesis protein
MSEEIAMVDLSKVGIASAFAAGVISFLSPCVLPLVPGYVSYVAGKSVIDPQRGRWAESRLGTAGLSHRFVLGFSSVFVLLGASADSCCSGAGTS